MRKGYLYVLANDSMPGMVKIGITDRDPSKRAKELRTTGVPGPFKLCHSIVVENNKDFEKMIHDLLSNRGVRSSPDREFFKIPVEEAITLVDTLADQHGGQQLDFTREIELNGMANALRLPGYNEQLDTKEAELLANKLQRIGRQGAPASLKNAAYLFAYNSPSAIKFREFTQEYLHLARKKALFIPITSSNGISARREVGKEVAEYVRTLHVKNWLIDFDFKFVSTFLYDGDRHQYEGYVSEIQRSGFLPDDIREKAEDV